MKKNQNEYSIDQTLGRLLKEAQAAEFLHFSTRALQNWRCRGGGPKYVRVSSRSVRYRLTDLIDWTTARLRSSTSED